MRQVMVISRYGQFKQEIIGGLIVNKTLRVLDISRNKLTDDIFEPFVMFIERSKVQELYFGWNIIGTKGANKLFSSLETNKNLKVLDISWNNISGDVTSLSNLIRNNTTLIHLDLSNNKFTFQESKTIAEALETNHTIYGFHFKGNYGIVDSLGFLVVDQKERNNENISYDSISGVKSQKQKKNIDVTSIILKGVDICWICDNWKQAQFEWKPQVSLEYKEDQEDILFLHPQYEQYRGIYFGQKNGTYILDLMVPQSKFHYFYSLNWQQEVAQDQPSYQIHKQLQDIYSQLKTGIFKITALNYLDQEQCSPIFNSDYQVQTTILPRTKRLEYDPPEDQIIEQKVWKFKDSVFAEYKKDTDAKSIRCFDFDCSQSKLDYIIKDQEDLEKSKSILKHHYKYIRNIYRSYSCLCPVGQIWAITIGPFTQFIKDLDILDSHCKEEDIHLKWTSVTSQPSINQRSPSRGIVRHQMIELLARLVDLKYVHSKVVNTFQEGFQIFLEKNLLPLARGRDHQEFRERVLWTEQADRVLKTYLEPLKQVYKNYSILNVLPGQKPFMCLEELLQISKAIDIGGFDPKFGEKDICEAFCLSKQCIIDEVMNNQIFELEFREFTEALGRIAFSISKPTLYFNSNLLQDPKYEEHYQAIKLESLIQKMQILYTKKKQTDFTFKDQSVFLKKDNNYLFGFYD